MTAWRICVPIKQGLDCKSRLGGVLDETARTGLARRMAGHVLAVLQDRFESEQITILSLTRPEGWAHGWMRDQGRGLNPELGAWRAAQGDTPVLILHADLPLLDVEDIDALLALAAGGVALATDRAGQGSNALAIADGRPFDMRFGARSRARHCAQYPDINVIEREGLMADLDTPDDARYIHARGFAV